ncbi:MAG: hypothetical protein N4A33_01885 [Bacteriovoracaceae bacterium]|jgi:hypothetical protein|nr:hypothetical protein [Bacteriovoracaceae bacterium]
MKYILLFITLSAISAPIKLVTTTDIYHNQFEQFKHHPYILAMNIQERLIKSLNKQLNKALNKKLKFKSYIEVITQKEFKNTLSLKMSMQEIIKIAEQYDIQNSYFSIFGIGSIQDKKQEEYFLIIDSPNLRNIRKQIYYKFIKKGGDKKDFDPTWFFPHLIIGQSQMIKAKDRIRNLKNTLNKNFLLSFDYLENKTLKE